LAAVMLDTNAFTTPTCDLTPVATMTTTGSGGDTTPGDGTGGQTGSGSGVPVGIRLTG